ncbi:DJ-1/PfpI family protein [Azospirillum himalayense]|uniref:DJ-1/PfpI family protein n=1 Tax=Azospirillum himalayense TaxID=654847 RepID=A0ABW0GAC1_9PROT
MRARITKIPRAISIAFFIGSVAVASMWPDALARAEVPQGGNANFNIPVHSARFSRQKPIVAVVAENSFTELTDYVIPFGVLSASGTASVFALATQQGPVQLFPALKVQPQATTAQFDARFPEGADFVIVPAVHRVDDATLIAWIRSQAEKGATIVGVCDGVWVVANAGLLHGKSAVGHWYSIDDLKAKFPETHFLRNRRYLADGNIVTTTGVTASIPVSIALVEAIAGRERAAAVAQHLGIKDWGASHRGEGFSLTLSSIVTAATNWLAFWLHEDIEIPVTHGTDEIALALAADAYSRTYRSAAYAQSTTSEPITTRYGLAVLPERVVGLNRGSRTVELPVNVPAALMLDETLRRIRNTYGAATEDFVSLQMEYPKP